MLLHVLVSASALYQYIHIVRFLCLHGQEKLQCLLVVVNAAIHHTLVEHCHLMLVVFVKRLLVAFDRLVNETLLFIVVALVLQ